MSNVIVVLQMTFHQIWIIQNDDTNSKHMDINSTTYFLRLCDNKETLSLLQVMNYSYKVPVMQDLTISLVSWTNSSKTVELLVVWAAITLM